MSNNSKRQFEEENDDDNDIDDGSILGNEKKKQFTASSLLKSAYETSQNQLQVTDYKIADLEELLFFQRRKRTEYENALRRNRFNYGQWMRYAQFEIDQKDLRRARSVFERALEVDYKNVTMWVRYIQSEIKSKNINHARNLLERATKLLPRIDKLWYMYLTIEESIGNVIAVSEIYEKWLQWKPIKDVWFHYVEFLERYKEYSKERLLFEKLVVVYNDYDSWLRWVEFEKKYGDYINVLNVYKLGVNSLYEKQKLCSKFLISWIKYEFYNKKYEKVKKLYEFGFQCLDPEENKLLQKFQVDFEKQYGVNSENIESLVLKKRKLKYEEQLQSNPSDYETWWTYLNLLLDSELEISKEDIEKSFESAISVIPDSNFFSNNWTTYWYLNYRFALWLEFDNKNIEAATLIYENFKRIVPHSVFTIVDFWYKYSEFKLRNFGLDEMRMILGQSIGLTSNEEIMLYYINMEIKLKYFERARKLYNKLIEVHSSNWKHWLTYFEFEDSLGNDDRSYSIVDVAISNEFLNNKSKIKLINSVMNKLIEGYNFTLAKKLSDYKIELTEYSNVNYIIQRCLLELRIPSEDQITKIEKEEITEIDINDNIKNNTRDQYSKYISLMKDKAKVQNRIVLLESLKNFEEKHGNAESIKAVQMRLPKMIRKFKEEESGLKEEYIEYVFPDDEREIEEQIDDFKNDFITALVEDDDDENDGEGESKAEIDDEENDDENDDEVSEDDVDDNESKKKSFKSRFESDTEEEEEEGVGEETQPVKKSFSSRFEE